MMNVMKRSRIPIENICHMNDMIKDFKRFQVTKFEQFQSVKVTVNIMNDD